MGWNTQWALRFGVYKLDYRRARVSGRKLLPGWTYRTDASEG